MRHLVRSAVRGTFTWSSLALCLTLTDCKRAASKPSTPPDPVVAEGQQIYANMCAVCHGAKGEGYAADFAPRLAQPDFLATVSDEFLRLAIIDGRTGTPMSAWGQRHAGPLDDAKVDAVIKYIKSWYSGKRPLLDPAPVMGDVTNGAQLFDQRCKVCHGERGRTGPNVRIGNPELLSSASNGFLRYAIAKGRPGTAMPAFEQSIGKQGIEDLVAALRHWELPVEPPRPAPPAPLPLGPVPLNPKGPDPVGFKLHPEATSATVIKAQLDRGARMAILDSRAPSDYLRQHIKGAVSVPFYDPSPYLDKLPKDSWLVCYCACPHAESKALATKLMNAGFKKVTVLDEGLNFWAGQKYGVEGTAESKPLAAPSDAIPPSKE